MKRLSEIIKLFYRPKIYPSCYDYDYEESKNGYTPPIQASRSIAELSNKYNISGYTEYRHPIQTKLIRFLAEDSTQ